MFSYIFSILFDYIRINGYISKIKFENESSTQLIIYTPFERMLELVVIFGQSNEY